MDPSPLQTLITQVTTIFTESIGWVGEFAQAVVGKPILLIFCILPLVGLGVGLFKRLLSVN